MFILGILLAIVLLLLIIVVHEAGHFFAARYFGMQTPVVGLGLPFGGPSWTLGHYKDVKFKLHPMLLGAYVAIPEMDDESAGELDTMGIKLLRPARIFPAWQRMIVSLAGPVANLLLALLIVFISACTLGKLDVSEETLLVNKISASATASVQEKLKTNDKLLEINNNKITNFASFLEQVKNSDNTINIKLLRDSKEIEIQVEKNSNNLLGIGIQNQPNKFNITKIDGLTAKVQYAWQEFMSIFVFCWSSIVALITAPFQALFGQESSVKAGDLHGIIEVTKGLAHMFEQQGTMLVKYTALLSAYIGMINLVPLLPLDGGHIVFQFLEIILGTKRKIINKIKEYYAQFGLYLILVLFVLVMFNDIKGLFIH